MNQNNDAKVVAITGSSKGIGKDIAKEFAKNGYSIVLNSRDEGELNQAFDEIKKEMNGQNNGISYVVGDISREEVSKRLIAEAIEKFGKINVLINNAGVGGATKKTSELSAAEWDEVIDINLKGAFLCTREALKFMLQNNDNTNRSNNSIINISSVHESIPQPESAPYAASKGGMMMFTKNVALEVADKGIRVNAIAPGAIATDMNKDKLEDKEKKKQEENKIPMHRIADPEEIAKVAFFLASSNASYITGTTVYADGGLTLSS
jgi:glucose 1-dehydrogenase